MKVFQSLFVFGLAASSCSVLPTAEGSVAGGAALKALKSMDYRYFVAGGTCAAFSHGITCPIDVVKVRCDLTEASTAVTGKLSRLVDRRQFILRPHFLALFVLFFYQISLFRPGYRLTQKCMTRDWWMPLYRFAKAMGLKFWLPA